MAIVKVTPDIIAQAVRETDWAAQDALSDDDIARQIADDPDAPPILDDAASAAGLVLHVRRTLGLSQSEFAARYRIPVGTLRDWEQGRSVPDKPTRAYLQVINREPEMTARALGMRG